MPTGSRPLNPAASRRVTGLLGALLVGHAALVWALHQRRVFIFGDDAAYLILARSVRSWSYKELQFIGEPIAGRFPPGYPAAVALWTSVFGESLGVIAILGLLASTSTLLAVFLIIRRRWSAELALLVVAVTAVNPALVTIAGTTASEALFTALTAWSLWAATVGDEPTGSRRHTIVAGALAVMAAMTRSAGVTLIGALGLEWVRRRRWGRVIGLAAASALTVGVWLAWTVYAPQRGLRRSYVDDAVTVRSGDGSFVGTVVDRVTTNVQAYAGQTIAGELGFPLSDATVIDNVGWLVFVGSFALIGFVSAWRRWRQGATYVAVYGVLLAIWPYTIERFVTPIVPMIIAFMLIGAWVLADQLTSRLAQYAPFVVGLVLATVGLVRDGASVERKVDCSRTVTACDIPAALDYIDAARFVATLPATESRLVTPKSATLYYHSGRQSPFWDEVLSLDSAAFRPYLQQHAIRYVIAAPVFHDYDILYRLLNANCTYFDLVRAWSPDTFIVVLRDTPRDDGANGPVCVATARAYARPRVS